MLHFDTRMQLERNQLDHNSRDDDSLSIRRIFNPKAAGQIRALHYDFAYQDKSLSSRSTVSYLQFRNK